MNFIRKLFGAKSQPKTQSVSKGKQYMLSSLGIPRKGTTLEERISKQEGKMAESINLGTVQVMLNWQDFARGQPPNSPLLVALQGRAQAIARLDKIQRSEAQQMRSAVEQGSVLLVPVLALCPTLPILGPRFVIFDNPNDPFTVEDPRDFRLADVQKFISAVIDQGEGDFHLYFGADAELVASGTFSLCTNPQRVRGLPYKSSSADREDFWQLLQAASKYLKEIPVTRQNFDAAVKYYFEQTSL